MTEISIVEMSKRSASAKFMFYGTFHSYWFDGTTYFQVHQTEDTVEEIARDRVLKEAKVHRTMGDVEEIENRFSRYPRHIKRKVRQCVWDVDQNDITHDDKIEKMKPQEVLGYVCQWEGLLGSYNERLMDWVQDIFDVDLREAK